MKVNIDISLFVGDSEAFGGLSGPIEFPVIPAVGDVVILFSSPNKTKLPASAMPHNLPRVTERILTASEDAEFGVSITLSDIVVDSYENAVLLSNYLQLSFDLFFVSYGK